MKRLFVRVYGEPPRHLVILLLSFAVCGYALVRLLRTEWLSVLEWVVGAAILHDVVLVPLYGGADWLLHKGVRAGKPLSRSRLAVVNHLRVPAFLSLLTLLVYWPSISRNAGTNYRRATGLSPDVFWPRWLLVTAVLFAASAALLALRAHRTRRRPGG
ncbi:hypothetical protein POF50_000455 [Streptomyces sp. SL13]|uniref:Uncharacterized protein n=1 Tax=Streptantibioticus silvisoli TaxID=2705255 RepID=A0AA90GWQ2_9ACTN|nr:hypothetical protein [Streptantibioticus silvisoli]MDI5967836.1 hypothetical protein [Streptantibioticus silvisoli]